jgi:hypothetical protein
LNRSKQHSLTRYWIDPINFPAQLIGSVQQIEEAAMVFPTGLLLTGHRIRELAFFQKQKVTKGEIK